MSQIQPNIALTFYRDKCTYTIRSHKACKYENMVGSLDIFSMCEPTLVSMFAIVCIGVSMHVTDIMVVIATLSVALLIDNHDFICLIGQFYSVYIQFPTLHNHGVFNSVVPCYMCICITSSLALFHRLIRLVSSEMRLVYQKAMALWR